MNRSVGIGAGAGLLVLALVSWWWGASSSEQPLDSVAADRKGLLVTGAGGSAPQAADPPAWSGVKPPAPGSAVGPGVPIGSELPAGGLSGESPSIRPGQPGAPGIDEIQAELQALTATGRQPSATEVDRVLAKLQQNQGKSAVGGVDLQALRNNLQLVERIRVLGEQMQPLAQNPSAENTQKMQAMAAEMMRLQSSMRLDVSVKQP